MLQWLVRRENSAGEWSVIDMIRNYRVCSYHRRRYGGVHIHVPIQGPPAGRVAIESSTEARAIMVRYAQDHDAFAKSDFLEEVKRFGSMLKKR